MRSIVKFYLALRKQQPHLQPNHAWRLACVMACA